MTKLHTLTFMCGLSLAATTAQADLTAQDVFETTKTWLQIDPDHAPMIGDVAETSEGLSASDIKLTYDDADVMVTVSIDNIMFTEMGDGSVEMRLSETIPVFVDTVDGSDKVHVELNMVSDNLRYVFSGEPDLMDVTVQGDKTEIMVTEATGLDDGLTLEGGMTLMGLDGRYKITKSDMQNIAVATGLEKIAMDIRLQDKSSGEGIHAVGTWNDFQGTGLNVLPLDMSSMDQSDPLAGGVKVAADYTYGAVDLRVDGMIEGSQFDVGYTGAGGDLSVAVDAVAMAFSNNVNDLKLNFLAAQMLPFPVETAFENFGIKLAMPVGKEEAADYEIGLNLENFTISDGIWNMLDPGEVLPRDPATLAVNIAGSAKWFFNLMNPEDAAAMEQATIPGEIYSAKLNTLNVSAAGAQLTGEGEFTFDNADFMTIPGMPRPEGSVALKLSGGDGLLDKLIQMGILSDDDAMGVRMMSGMFAQPGSEADTLTSEIVVNAEGQVSANGQRLR